MRALLRWCLFLVVSFVPAAGHSAPSPTVTVTLRDAGVAQLKAVGFAPGTFCAPTRAIAKRYAGCTAECTTIIEGNVKACAAGAAACEKAAKEKQPACQRECEQVWSSPANAPFSFVVNGSNNVIEDGVTLAGASGALTSKLLETGSVWCAAPDKSEPTQTAVTIPKDGVSLPLSSTTGAWRSFENPNRFEWLGWDRPAFVSALNELLRTAWTCEFTPQTKPTNACTLTRDRGANGGLKLVFDAERNLTKDTTITVKGTAAGKAVVVTTLSLDQCTYSAKGAPANGAIMNSVRRESSAGGRARPSEHLR